MATDPKKDQKDQPERIAEAGKSAELTDEQVKDIAAGDNSSVPARGDDQLKARRND